MLNRGVVLLTCLNFKEFSMKNSLLNLSDPFFSTRFLGFDTLFDSLRNFSEIGEDSRSYPPYNIKKEGKDIVIEVAVAGLSEEDLIVETKENNLSISHEGSKNSSGEILHQGIAARAFKLQFSLAPEVVVKTAELKNGLLKINLERIIPESEKAKVIQINSGEIISE
tara:strand:+ start:86 stop:586 length:501 start_codon:yes stop_codon:yes gene_type:complete